MLDLVQYYSNIQKNFLRTTTKNEFPDFCGIIKNSHDTPAAGLAFNTARMHSEINVSILKRLSQ